MSTTAVSALTALATAVIVPVVTAALAVLASWLKQRSERRDRDQERHRVLTQVREEIDVIEAWIKAYELVAPPELRSQMSSRAQNELELAYTRLAESLELTREVEPRKTFGQYFKGPQPKPSRYPAWRKTYLWLISLTGMIGCVALLATALAPSPGNHVRPLGGVLGTLGLLVSAWIGWYAHRIPLNTAKDTELQPEEQKSSNTTPT